MLKLIIDSREQLPLEFKQGVFDEIVVEGRPVGDYWAEMDGTELPFCYERKAIGDLFSTMTHGYKRFKNEMKRAQENSITLILLIEGSMKDVHRGYKHSSFSGDSMLRKLATMRLKYDLEWHCFNDRREMAKFIELHFDAVKRNWKKITQSA